MTDLTLWPTIICHSSLDLGDYNAALAEVAVARHQFGPLPHQRFYYDIFEEMPALWRLRDAAIAMVRDYLDRALHYATRFDIAAKGWANTYEPGQYIMPHTHLGDLTMSYCARGAVTAAVTDPRPLAGFGRAREDWATRFIPLKPGEVLLHPSGISHHLAPVAVRSTLISIDFYVTPAKGETVPMGGGYAQV